MNSVSEEEIEAGPFGGTLTDVRELERQPIPIPDRSTFIPSWAPDHAKNIEVRDAEGNGLGFGIAEVAPERRWAIGEDGCILPQHEFEDAHLRWSLDAYKLAGQPAPDMSVRPIVNCEDFVRKKVSPSDPTRTVHITTGLHTERELEEIPEDFVEGGRGWEKREAKKVDARAKELEGLLAKLDEMGGVEALEKLLGEGAVVDAAPDNEPEEEKNQSQEAAPCGKMVKVGFVRQHARFCKDEACVAMLAEPNPPDEAA